MAKLKLWVKNLIISVVLVVCLIGTGVGMYFVLRPNEDAGGKDSAREMTAAQKAFANAINKNQLDVEYSGYSSFVMEDGSAVDPSQIITTSGKYFVLQGDDGRPAFYKLVETGLSDTSDATDPEGEVFAEENTASEAYEGASIITGSTEEVSGENIATDNKNKTATLQKIAIAGDDYNILSTINDAYAISGDFALLDYIANSDQTSGTQSQSNAKEPKIVSLITGEIVLEGAQIYKYLVTSGDPNTTIDYVDIVAFENGYLLTSKMVAVVANSDASTFEGLGVSSYSLEYTLYNLTDTTKTLTIGASLDGEASEYLLDYSLGEDYVVVSTSEHTHIMYNALGENGELAYVIDANEIVNSASLVAYDATSEQLESKTYITLSDLFSTKIEKVEYTMPKFLPNGYMLLEKRTLVNPSAEGFDAYSYSSVNVDSNNYYRFWGYNYSFVDLSSGEKLVQNPISVRGRIEVAECRIDGYMLLLTYVGDSTENYRINTVYAHYYLPDFTELMSYRYYLYGDAIYYDGEYFLGYSTSGTAAMFNVFGEYDYTMTTGYTLISKNVYNNFVVLESNSGYYVLYNLETKTSHANGYTYMTQISGGKVIAYRASDGLTVGAFYLLTLNDDGTIDEEILPNFDVSAGSLNVVSASLGYYVDKMQDGTYRIVCTNDSGVYTGVTDFSIKIIGGYAWTFMTFSGGGHYTLVTNCLSNMGAYSDDDIAEEFPLDEDLIASAISANSAVSASIDLFSAASTTSTNQNLCYLGSGSSFYGGITVDINGDTGVPTYSINTSTENTYKSDRLKSYKTYLSSGNYVSLDKDLNVGYFKYVAKIEGNTLNNSDLVDQLGKWWSDYMPTNSNSTSTNINVFPVDDVGQYSAEDKKTYNLYGAEIYYTPYLTVVLLRYVYYIYYTDGNFHDVYFNDRVFIAMDNNSYITGKSYIEYVMCHSGVNGTSDSSFLYTNNMTPTINDEKGSSSEYKFSYIGLNNGSTYSEYYAGELYKNSSYTDGISPDAINNTNLVCGLYIGEKNYYQELYTGQTDISITVTPYTASLTKYYGGVNYSVLSENFGNDEYNIKLLQTTALRVLSKDGTESSNNKDEKYANEISISAKGKITNINFTVYGLKDDSVDKNINTTVSSTVENNSTVSEASAKLTSFTLTGDNYHKIGLISSLEITYNNKSLSKVLSIYNAKLESNENYDTNEVWVSSDSYYTSGSGFYKDLSSQTDENKKIQSAFTKGSFLYGFVTNLAYAAESNGTFGVNAASYIGQKRESLVYFTHYYNETTGQYDYRETFGYTLDGLYIKYTLKLSTGDIEQQALFIKDDGLINNMAAISLIDDTTLFPVQTAIVSSATNLHYADPEMIETSESTSLLIYNSNKVTEPQNKNEYAKIVTYSNFTYGQTVYFPNLYNYYYTDSIIKIKDTRAPIGYTFACWYSTNVKTSSSTDVILKKTNEYNINPEQYWISDSYGYKYTNNIATSRVGLDENGATDAVDFYAVYYIASYSVQLNFATAKIATQGEASTITDITGNPTPNWKLCVLNDDNTLDTYDYLDWGTYSKNSNWYYWYNIKLKSMYMVDTTNNRAYQVVVALGTNKGTSTTDKVTYKISSTSSNVNAPKLINLTTGSERTFKFKYANLFGQVEYSTDSEGSVFCDISSLSDNSNTITINSIFLVPMNYNIYVATASKSHVYSSDSSNSVVNTAVQNATLYEGKLQDENSEITNQPINEKDNYVTLEGNLTNMLEEKVAGGSSSGYDYKGTGSAYKSGATSSTQYVLAYTDFAAGLRLRLNLLYTDFDGTWVSVDYYFYNGGNGTGQSYNNYNYYTTHTTQGSSYTFKGKNGYMNIEATFDTDKNTLTITISNLVSSMGSAASNDIILTSLIDTLPYEVSVGEIGSSLAVNNNASLSDNVHSSINTENNTSTSTVGKGTTVLVELGDELYEYIGNDAGTKALTKYISYLQIEYNNKTVYKLTNTSGDDLKDFVTGDDGFKYNYTGDITSDDQPKMTSDDFAAIIKMLYKTDANLDSYSCRVKVLTFTNENGGTDTITGYLLVTTYDDGNQKIALMFNNSQNWEYLGATNSSNFIADAPANTISVYMETVEYISTVSWVLDTDGSVGCNTSNDLVKDKSVSDDNEQSYGGIVYKTDGNAWLQLADATTATDFAKVSPASKIVLNLGAKTGYYISGIDITYNGTTYTVSVVGFGTNTSTYAYLSPVYCISGNDKDTYFSAGDPKTIGIGLTFTAYQINLDSASTDPILSLQITGISSNCNIRVTYGTYMVGTFVYSENSENNGNTEKCISVAGSATDTNNGYIEYKPTTENGGQYLYVQNENGATISTISLGQYDETYNRILKVNVGDEKKLILVFLGYSVNASSPKFEVESTFNETSSYTLEENFDNKYTEKGKSTDQVLLNNSADKVIDNNRKLTVKSTFAGSTNSKCIVSIKIKDKSIETKMQSDIDFGGSVGVIQENTTAEESSTKLYNTSGQIASKDTTLEYSSNNGAQSSSADYYANNEQGQTYKIYGNKIVYTFASQFGYTYTGFTIDIMDASGTITNTINGRYSEDAIDYIYAYIECTAKGTQLTITIKDINIQLLVTGHYKAKTFVINYNSNADFGSSNINEADTYSRTFTYNVKSVVDVGTDTQNAAVSYSRNGYSLYGWSFVALTDADKFQNDNILYASNPNFGKIIYSDPSTSGKNKNIYIIKTDGDTVWYNSLGTYGNSLFSESGITMYAVWQAEDYELTMEYNDSTNGNGSSTATKYTVKWVFDQPVAIYSTTDANRYSFASSTSLTTSAGSTLKNYLWQSTRLGYTFDGWYTSGGTFGGDDWDNNNLLLAGASSVWYNGDATLTFDNTLYQKLAISEDDLQITLYAKWSANQYSIYFDVNDAEDSVIKALQNLANITNITSDSENLIYETQVASVGTGSSAATLVQNGAIIITFDQEIPESLNSYAYRYGYRFLGWFATRAYTNSEDYSEVLLEGGTFDIDYLMYMLNYYDDGMEDGQCVAVGNNRSELDLVKNKALQNGQSTIYQSNVHESLTNSAATITADQTQKNQTISAAENGAIGNFIIAHARWQALTYVVSVDLNNWTHSDYAWEDADYAVGGTEIVTNVVDQNILRIEIVFDTKFGNATFILNNRNISYSEAIAQITSYGYTISDPDGNIYNFSLREENNNNVGNSISPNTIFDYSMLNQARYFVTKVEADANISVTNSSNRLAESDDSNKNIDRHSEDYADFAAMAGDHGRYFTIFVQWYNKVEVVANGNTEYTNSETDYSQNTAISDIAQLVVNSTSQNALSYRYGDNDVNKNKDIIYFVPSYGTYAKTVVLKFVSTEKTNKTEGYITISTTWDDVLKRTIISSIVCDVVGTNGALVEVFSIVYDTSIYTQAVITATNDSGEVDATTVISTNGGEYTLEKIIEIFTQFDTSALIDSTSDAYTLLSQFATISIGSQTVTASTLSSGWGKVSHLFEGFNFNILDYITSSPSNKTVDASMPYSNEYIATNIFAFEFDYIKSNVIIGYQPNSTAVGAQLSSSDSEDFLDSSVNMAQTYRVDYYNLILPNVGTNTSYTDEFGNTTEDEQFPSYTFLSGWSQYLVRKTLTYRFGEYIDVRYSYAAGYSFDNWYYYAGHTTTTSAADTADYNNTNNTRKYFTVQTSDQLDDETQYTALVESGYWAENAGSDPTTHQYAESEYAVYQTYSREPITSTLCIVGIYRPTEVHQVHYYVWNNAKNCYEERLNTSSAYVLGTKRYVKVTDVPDGNQNSIYSVNYFELGTNTDYYYTGFTGLSSLDNSNALAFLLQFVTYEGSMSSTSTGITWSDLKSKIAASSLLKEWLGESVANVYSNSDSPVVMAQKIFVKLLSTFDVASYFTDENVISQMSFYSDFAKKYSLTMDNIYKYFSVKGSEELLNKLCCQKYLTDLDTLLDNISMDYFGYVLKNPSQNSGYWPSGTYFAGWIQVKATGGTIVDDLTTNGAQQVFTLDYATWVSAGMSIKAVNSDLSSATVKHNEDGKNYEYKITQFLAKVKGQKVDDQSNRVDKDVYVFAAYNAQVFDINLTNDTMNMTIKLGDVMSDGTVYEYTTDDIVIVKLTETQRDKYLELIANGAARPTALREVLGNQAGWAYANRSTAISNLKNSGGGYLVAFVYKKTYGTGGKIVNDSNNIIYEVSDTWISYDGIALKVIDEQTGE